MNYVGLEVVYQCNDDDQVSWRHCRIIWYSTSRARRTLSI